MNKILVILNIECELFYQIFDGKVMSNLRVKTINHNLGVVISEILDDKDLISSGNIGVILIDDNVQTLTVLKKYLHSNHSILKVFDNYVQAISGNSLENYTSWCIVDSLTEQIRAYSLDEKPKTVSKTLNKTSTKNHFFNKVIDKTFTGNKPNISKKERNELSERWIEKLNQTKQLSGSIIIDGQDEFLNVDYKEFTKWIIGDFSEDIMRKIPNKTVVFIFGEFLNNSIFKGRLKEYYNKLEFKSEEKAAEFIINGAFHLCKDEADKEIRAIKAKDEECKCYTEPELNELYKGHNIRFFIADAKALKDLYGFKTDNRGAEEAVREEIVKTIGDRLEVDKTTKDKLIASAKKTCISVSFVEAEIEKKCEENIKIFKEKVILDIAIITNRHKKDKSIFTSSKKLKQNILKEVERINTKGLGIDKEKTVQSQLSALDDFYSIYKGNPDAITVDKLPKGIQSIKDGKALIKGIGDEITTRRIAFSILGFVALVIIVFGISQFIPNENDEDSLPTPLPIPTSVQKILNQKTFSKSSLQNTINVLLNLPINDEINRTKIEEHLKNKIGNKSVLILIQHANSNMTSDEKLLFYDFIEEVAADGAGGSLKLINSLTIESVGKTEIIVTEKER